MSSWASSQNGSFEETSYFLVVPGTTLLVTVYFSGEIEGSTASPSSWKWKYRRDVVCPEECPPGCIVLIARPCITHCAPLSPISSIQGWSQLEALARFRFNFLARVFRECSFARRHKMPCRLCVPFAAFIGHCVDSLTH